MPVFIIAYGMNWSTTSSADAKGGFPVELFSERTGLPFSAMQRALDRGEEQGLLERDLKTIRPTERGQRFLNELLGLFLSDGTRAPGSGDPGAVRAIRISLPAAK